MHKHPPPPNLDSWYCITPSVVLVDDDQKDDDDDDFVGMNYDTTNTTTSKDGRQHNRRSLKSNELDLLNSELLFIYKPSGMNCVPPRNVIEGGEEDSDLATQVSKVFGPQVKPCHRLDRDTSGIVIFSLTKSSHRQISKQFENRVTHKTYLALISGHPLLLEDSGIIDLPIGKMMTPEGYNRWTCDVGCTKPREAITQYNILERRTSRQQKYSHSMEEVNDVENNNQQQQQQPHKNIIVETKYTKIELLPKTGRGHQLRLHMKYGLDCPILGDTIHAVSSGTSGGGGGNRLSRDSSSSSSTSSSDENYDDDDDDTNSNGNHRFIIDDDAIGLCSPRLCLHAWKIQINWNGLRLEATSIEPF